jgi:hypothetical protein
MGGSVNLPPPFVIDAPVITSHLGKASRVCFGFVAIGPMCDSLNYCVEAFRDFGKAGLASQDGQQRAMFALCDVRDQLDHGRSVFCDGQLGAVRQEDVLETVGRLEHLHNFSELVVRFLTNTQIGDKTVKSSRPLDRIKTFDNFWSFMSQVSHRAACLWQVYGNDWQGKVRYGEEKRSLGQASSQIKTTENNLEKRELWGHSNPREVDKGLHGFIGTMKFAGDFSAFMHLLRIGELVHIGSETASGLGQYSLFFTNNGVGERV